MLVAVIGGGAAGMAAAYAAADKGAQVVLFEQNEKLGKKVYISGKGRCNLTNDSPIENHVKNVVSNPRFLYSAYHAFPPEDLIALIESTGVSLKTERGGRVFPVSDKASDVISAWQILLQKKNVAIRLNERILSIEKNEERFLLRTSKGETSADRVILATGGFTYQATGSTGDGYRFAEAFGHSLVPLCPSLVGLKVNIPIELAGLSLKNVAITVKKGGKTVYADFGEMLFTHSGVSGPMILSASAKINRLDLADVMISIDLKPALTPEVLDERLLRELSAGSNKILRNVMPTLLPKSLIDFVLRQAKIDPMTPCHSVTKAERGELVNTLKGLTIRPTGFEEFNGAIVTAGGVSVREVDPKDMQSKLVKGLFFAGELLDVDAMTGGYNLQIAFSTGYLAGLGAANA